MTAAEIIRQVRSAGGQIAVDGINLVLTAPRPLPDDLLDRLKAHKHALLEALAHPDPLPPLPRGLGGYAGPPGVPPLGGCELARQIRSMPEDGQPEPLWWRIAITEPGGRTIEVDFPSGLTLCEATAYAERYHGPCCAVTPIAGLPKPRAPVSLDEAIRAACEGVAGIIPAQFRSLLSPEDIDDIAAGGIHPKTLHGYAQSFAEGIQDLKEFFEERSAILEHDAGLPRADAELEAARITATYARNRGCLWASLRAALADYPALLAQVPDRAGTVDSLSFGTATVHVREGAKPGPVSGSIVITEAEIEAARKGRTVVRQGTFSGAPEIQVKA